MKFDRSRVTTSTALLGALLLAACGGAESVAQAPREMPSTDHGGQETARAAQEGPVASNFVPAPVALPVADSPQSRGVTFQHPLGFALSLPPGWTSADAGGGQFQFVPPDARANEAVALTAARVERRFVATDADAIASTEQEISRQHPQLRRVGVPQRLQTRAGEAVRIDWEGALSDGSPARLAVYLAAVDQLAVSILLAGHAGNVAARSQEVEMLFTSLRASVPPASAAVAAPSVTPGAAGALHDGSAIARDWAQRLAGQKLTILSGYTSSGNSGGMNARYDLVLGRDGRFAYSGSSSVSMSVEGLGGSSVSQESSEGAWRVIAQGNAAVLELANEKGKQYGELVRRGSETYLGGTRVFVTDP